MRDLFSILESKNLDIHKEISVTLSNKRHPFFQAHFQNNEILAGFLQIDIIANILGHTIKKIKKAKFLSVVKPEDTIKYFINSNNNINYNIVIKNMQNEKVSEISYEI